MKISIIFLFILISLQAFSQNENVLVKFSPLALLDPNTPAIQAGIELRLSKKITWYNEFGIKYAKSISEAYTDTAFVASTGFKIKSEIRYYLEDQRRFAFDENYFAANIFFIQDQHNRGISYNPNNTTFIQTDDFGVKKNVFGINFLYGHQDYLSGKFLIDTYAGIGIRFRNIQTVDEEYNKNTGSIVDPTDPKVFEIGEQADANGGFSVLPNLTLGFRLCYRL